MGIGSSPSPLTPGAKAPQLSAAGRREFLSWSCNHFLGLGLQALASDVRRAVEDVTVEWTVRSKLAVSSADMVQLWARLRSRIDQGDGGAELPHFARYLIKESSGEESIALLRRNGLSDVDILAVQSLLGALWLWSRPGALSFT